jgi:Beta-propeller repeat
MRLLIGLLLAAAPGYSAAQQDRSLPLFFFPNTGQTDASVRFIVQTPDLSARFRPDSAIFQAHQQQIKVRFASANLDASVGGLEPLSAKINFFLGNTGWKKDVPSYSKIVYRGLYPGIDMTYGGTGRQVKSEFLVSPGANPALIRLEYSEPVSIDAYGNLLAGADFREAAPEIYQQIGAERVKIAGHYRVLDAHTVGFEIGAYDVSAPLVIDPTITYCTYLGGSGTTAITGVAVDSSDSLYVTGWTAALNFPIDNAVEASNQGGVDVIVAKLNAAGTALIYATYIGGRSNDQGAGIAVDSLGQAYVTGMTSSSNFPLVLSNRGGIGGTTTAFALKLNATGNTLLYSGYIGGTVYDTGAAIAVDTNFNAYVSGTTQSSNFPTLNPTQASFGGGVDVFITKLNSAGTITFSTFLGGSGNEEAGGIAVDSVGNIFVAGGTSSTNFPVVSPCQGTLAGSEDAFVTKIGFAGAVAFSTYLGGSGGSPQQASAIALDSAGNPYITGVTTSSNFPVTSGAFQTVLNGLQNAFVAKLTNTGQTLVYGTYLGGSSYDWGYGIAVNAAGDAYIAGATSSVDFPQMGAVQAAFNGAYDAFITELNFGGTALIFSTYYGGSGSDTASAIAVDINTNIFVGGQTSSSNLPLVVPIQSTISASSTGWLVRLGVTAPPTTTPSVVSVSPTSGSGSSVTFTAQYSDTGGGSILTTAALVLNTSASTGSGCYVSYNPAMNLFSIYTDAGTTVLATLSPGTGSAQNDQCGLSGVGSSATVSGTTLTVTFSLSFLPAFAGSKTVYLLAADANSTTALTAETSFSVTINPGTPQVVSVSPSAAGGSAQTFTFVYSDTVIASNLSNVAFLFNTSVNPALACSVLYSVSAGTVSLITDSGVGSSSLPLGSADALQNSQCVITTTSASTSGLSLTVTVAITFKGAFNGAKNIYMEDSTASANSGFVLEGTYTVNAGGSPVAVSAVPGSGSGPGERFSFTLADPGGSGFITSAAILFASTFNTTNACYLIWDGTANTISLTFDNPANGQTPFAPGAQGIATNEQCTMNAANSTIVKGATQVVVTLDLTFNSTFFGAKSIYLFASEAFANSGWTTVGTWTVTGGASTANSVSPNSGSGTSQTFLFTVADSSSQTNVTGMQMLLTSGAPTNITNACYLVYNRTNATIGLWDNTGNTTLSTKGIGSSANLLNTQCAVGFTAMNVVGSTIQFSIQLVFFAPFAGPQSIYLDATEPNTSSGFVYQGSWTVP